MKHNFYYKVIQLLCAKSGFSKNLFVIFLLTTNLATYSNNNNFLNLEKNLQTKRITGRVVDENNEPIIGATVRLDSSKETGTITDNNGNFSIANVPSNAILIISFVGYETLEINSSDRVYINVTLKEDAINLNEIVAIGYGTVKKADLTGAVSGMRADRFSDQSIYTLENSMSGRISGVKVIDGAQPGSGSSITIRGANSMLGGTQPLYVIDGIPVEPNQDARGQAVGGSIESSMNFLDPSSIERIDVLKDASATAIYGARGANGVVLITTKQGSSSTRELTFNYSMNVSSVSKERDVLDGHQFADWINMESSNISWLTKTWFEYKQKQYDNGIITQLPSTTPWGHLNTPEEYNNPKWWFNGNSRPLPGDPNLPNTNWQKEIFQTSITNNYNLGYSGSSLEGSYSFGLNYLDQKGIIIGSKYNRLNSFLNLNRDINKRLKVSSRINLTRGASSAVMTNNGHYAQNVISRVVSFAPTNTPLGAGDSFEDFDFNDPNYQDDPIAIVTKLLDDKEQVNFIGSANLNYLILPGLRFITTGAFVYNTNNRDTYWPKSTARGKASNGDATSARNQYSKYLGQFQLNYNKTYNRIHSFNAIAVYSNETMRFRQNFVQVKNFPTDNLIYKNLGSGIDYSVPESNFYKTVLDSYLGRVNYSLMNKYLFTLSFRTDGSSKFAKNNKWAFFPSAAFAWRISEESFMNKQQLFSNLKLRLSYGKTGNEAISPYQSLATLGSKNYVFGDKKVSGFYENNLENTKLKWEATDQYNIGLDIGFFKNRLNLTLDAYYKRTDDLLMLIELPPSSGFARKIDNIGSVENKGVEAEVNFVPIDNTFKWTIYGNVSMNRNKVLHLGESGMQYSNFSIRGYRPIIFKEGEAMGSFIGFEKEKIFETWEEVSKSAQPTAYVGDVMYKDRNNDGVLNNDDMIIIGNPNPKALWGITNEFKYKNIDFSFLIDGQIGGQIYSVENMQIGSNYISQATVVAAKNSWIPNEKTPRGIWTLADGTEFSSEDYVYPFGNSNPYSATPMFNRVSKERSRISDEYIRDATFVKFRNISIGYTINPQWIKSLGAKRARLYLSATNLFTITKFDGFDPEVSAFTQNPSMQGLDFGTYPLARTFTFGVNVAF